MEVSSRGSTAVERERERGKEGDEGLALRNAWANA